MSENYYGFKKFCELLNDSNILKKHSVMGVIKMLQLCIVEIKSEVLLKFSKEGTNDYYLEYLINEIEKQDYLKGFGIDKIDHILKDLNITFDQLINFNYPHELNETIDVKLSWDEYYENFDYLRKTQENLLLYCLNYYANELITFLKSLKSKESKQKEELDKEAKKKGQEVIKNIFGSVSFKFDNKTSADEFHEMHKGNFYFKDSLSKNPNFLRDLYVFLSNENRPIKTTYEIFEKTLNLYVVEGHPLFYMRFSNPESVVIYPASLKMQYLEQLKIRKRDLLFSNIKALKEEINYTYDLIEHYTKNIANFFSYDEDIKNNADGYSCTLMKAISDLLSCALPYFKDLTPDEILGINDNRLNIVKADIAYSFQTFHELIRHIGLKYSPYIENQAAEFIFGLINTLNKRYFEFSYLFEVLDSEAKKIYNENVYEKIIEKNKLLETHQFDKSKKPQSRKRFEVKSKIFLNSDAQVWFNNTLQELSAINIENQPERSFQAICNAIFRDKNCKAVIFKNRLSLNKYIDFLNDEYKADIKSKTNLSNPQNYIDDIANLIALYQKDSLPNKPE